MKNALFYYLFIFHFLFLFIYLFIFVHTLINNEWPQMKIHTQMNKLSPCTDVTWILTDKTTPQNKISEPLPMKWNRGKRDDCPTCSNVWKTITQGEKRIVSCKQWWGKRKMMNITSGDMWCQKIVMKWCQSGKYHNEEWEMRLEYVCQV